MDSEFQVLTQCKLMREGKSKLFGCLSAIRIISGVVAGIIFLLPLFSDKSLPSGADNLMLVSGIVFLVSLVVVPIVRAKKKDLTLTLEANGNNDIAVKIQGEKENITILNPDRMDHYFHTERTGTKMQLEIKHLALCLIKDGDVKLLLLESYGHGHSPSLDWEERAESDVAQHSLALRNVAFRVTNFKEPKLEGLVHMLRELGLST